MSSIKTIKTKYYDYYLYEDDELTINIVIFQSKTKTKTLYFNTGWFCDSICIRTHIYYSYNLTLDQCYDCNFRFL